MIGVCLPACLPVCVSDRATAIGKMIDAYLKQSTEIDDQSLTHAEKT